jgi:anti-sigma-K factor RskA
LEVMELDHESVKDLIAPYVLGAVSPIEERQIRDHIISCDECMAQAESFAVVSAALPLAADPVPLPQGFTDRVIGRTQENRPAVDSPAAAGHPPWYRRWSGFPALATAALLVVALVLGASLLNEHRSLDQRQKVLAALLHHDQDAMELRGTSSAVAKVVPTENGSIFVAAGLRKAPNAHTYQLWLIKNGSPVSAGTFDISNGIAVLESRRSLAGYDQAAVTVEPAGGSQQPTTRPIIASD